MEEKLNQIIELIQGLDVKIQNLDIKVEEKYQELDEKIDKGYQELNEKMDKIYQELNAKIDAIYQELNIKIEQLNIKIDKKYQELDAKIEKKNQDLIKDISFEFRQVTDVVYYAMDRKDNRLKEKIKEALHSRDEQEIKIYTSTVKNLDKLRGVSLGKENKV